MVGQTGGCPPPVCTGHHSLEAPCRSQVLCRSRSAASFLQLSATDASVRTTMKGAAKCDEHCKLQNSANQQNFERILRFRDMPESMPTSESHWFHVLGLLSEHVFVHQHVSLLLMHRVYWCTSSKEHIEHSCASAPCLDLHHRDDRRNHFCTRHEVRSANPLNLSI